MEHEIDKRAAELEAEVNRLIQERCANESWRLHESIAAQIIDELLTDWDYINLAAFGQVPRIVLTSYNSRH